MTDETRSRYLSILPALVAYALVDLLFFGNFLLPGRFLYGGDFMTYFYPMRHFLREQVLEHGSLPLWNPYLLCGYPFIADIQVSAFYPGGILLYLFSPEKSYAATLAIHFLLMAMGMYLFAGEMGYSRKASWIAGLVYAFNGFALRNLAVGHLTLFQTMAMAPWMWWSYVRAVRMHSTRGWASVSIFTAFILFGGCPQNALYALLFLLMLAICLPWFDPEIKLRKSAMVFIAAVGAGFMAASAQLLPTAEFTAWTPRANGISLEAAMSGSLHPADLLNLFFPKIFGSPIDGSYWLDQDVHPFWEAGSYAGILAVTAVFGFRWKCATRVERVCMLILVFSLLFALGKYNPIVPFIQSLPVFNFFRGPIRLLYLAVTAVSILSAGLIHRLEQTNFEFPFRQILFWFAVLLSAVFCVFCFVGELIPEQPVLDATDHVLSAICVFFVGMLITIKILWAASHGKIKPAHASLLLSGLLILDLFMAGKFLFIQTRMFEHFQADVRQIRDRVIEEGSGKSRIYERAHLDMGNLPLLAREFGIRGYNPMMLAHYVRFILKIEGIDPSFEDHFTYVDLKHPDHPALRMTGLRYALDLIDPQTRIFPEALPRAFWVRDAVWLAEEEALEKVCDETFDPARQIILSGKNNKPVDSPSLSPDQEGNLFSASACRVTEYEPNRLRIEIDAPDTGGYLFLSDVFYPGWRADIDGTPSEILRANYLFRAVNVPVGRHTVEMRYEPRSFGLGLALSAAGFLICAVFFRFGRPRMK